MLASLVSTSRGRWRGIRLLAVLLLARATTRSVGGPLANARVRGERQVSIDYSLILEFVGGVESLCSNIAICKDEGSRKDVNTLCLHAQGQSLRTRHSPRSLDDCSSAEVVPDGF